MNFRVLLFSVAVVISVSFIFSVKNTWKWASDFQGLLILSMLPDDARSLNPFSEIFVWVSQDTAVEILTNYTYPYENCSNESKKWNICGHSRIGSTLSFIDGSKETEDRILKIIRHLIEENEPLNDFHQGFSPLQSAILFKSDRIASALLIAGSNPALKVKGNSSSLSGLNSLELINKLTNGDPEKMAELKRAMATKMPNKKRNEMDGSDEPPIR